MPTTSEPSLPTRCPVCFVRDEDHHSEHHTCMTSPCQEWATTLVQTSSRGPMHARCDRHLATALAQAERFDLPLVLSALPRYEPSLLTAW